MSTIGNRIKQRRIKLGLSVDELARRLEKNRATVYRYENDEIENMPVGIIDSLSKILDTTPAFIMGWADDDSANDPAILIRKAREAADLSVDELAKLINVDVNLIYEFESGERLPDMMQAIMLQHAINVNAYSIVDMDTASRLIETHANQAIIDWGNLAPFHGRIEEALMKMNVTGAEMAAAYVEYLASQKQYQDPVAVELFGG